MPRKTPSARSGKGSAKHEALTIRPLTPRLMDDLGVVLRGSWGSACRCMHPRPTEAQMRTLPGGGAKP